MKSKRARVLLFSIVSVICVLAITFGVLKSGETNRRKLQIFCFVDGGRIVMQEDNLLLVKKVDELGGDSFSIWSRDGLFYRVLEYRIGYSEESVAKSIFITFINGFADNKGYAEDTDDEEKNKDYQLLNKFIEVTENTFPGKFQRSLYWEEKECSENSIGVVQVPIIDEGGMQDLSWFCENIRDWLENCLSEVSYDEAPWLYKELIIAMPSVSESFDPSPYMDSGYDKNALYEGLYDFVDKNLSSAEYPIRNQNYGMLEFVDNGCDDYLATIEPDCTYTTKDGIVYKMLPVDRAAGSSYYSLAAYNKDSGKTSEINENPYCGMGGQAKWLTFINDSNLGFSCLTYNGGDDAFLFRTEDGGKSFMQVNYPSAKVKFSDGTIYNPFTIPEKVWAEGEDLYMLARQSPNSGDYYSEELGKHPSGLYVSHDDGLSFEYVGEQ